MRKRSLRLATLFILVIALIFAVSAHALPDNEVHYDVYCTCVGPTGLCGQWILHCDHTWEGWGSRPGDACTSTIITQEIPCTP